MGKRLLKNTVLFVTIVGFLVGSVFIFKDGSSCSYELVSRRTMDITQAVAVHPMLVTYREMLSIVNSSGREAAVMAVNPRSVPEITIRAVMQAAMDAGTPIIFELAASEMNVDPDASLKSAYTGLTPLMLSEMINRIAFELNCNVPFVIHGDHTSVKSNTPEAIAAAEALVKAEVQARFSAIALDPSHCMELDPVKLTERLNSLSFEDLLLIPDVGKVLAQQIIDHGEFSNLDELRDVEGVGENIAATIQTYLELKDNIDIIVYLAQFMPEGMGLEVEVGEIGKIDPKTGEQALTSVLEATVYIRALQARGVFPDFLAIHNGTAHGNNFDAQGNVIPQLGISVQRTAEVAEAIAPYGVIVAQHGTSGTSLENMILFPKSGIGKANVATNWQNIMFANLPTEMRRRIIQWVLDNFGDQRSKYSSNAEWFDKNIKFANKPLFRGEFGEIPQVYVDTIYQAAYDSAMEYFRAFGSVGLIVTEDSAHMALQNILSVDGMLIERINGDTAARISETGKRLVLADGITASETIDAYLDGRLILITQSEVIDITERPDAGLFFTGGGDCAGLGAAIGSFAQYLMDNTGLRVFGVSHARDGLVVAPDEFNQHLIYVDSLLASSFITQSSTPLGSARGNPFEVNPNKPETEITAQNAWDNVAGFSFMASTGGDDHLGAALATGERNPSMVVVATPKSMDKDVSISGRIIISPEGEEVNIPIENVAVQSLGAVSAVTEYQKGFWSAVQNAASHNQVHVGEDFGREAGNVTHGTSARYPANFDQLDPETQRKIIEYRDTVMSLVPERPTSLASIAEEALRVHREEGSVVVLVSEGFVPTEVNEEMKRILEECEEGDNDFREGWRDGTLSVDQVYLSVKNELLRDMLHANRGLAEQFANMVANLELDEFGNVAKLAGARHFVIQAIKSNGASKVNELLWNYQGRGTNPTEYDIILGQNVGTVMGELVENAEPGTYIVAYLEGMDPYTQRPVVIIPTAVSNGNNLNDTTRYTDYMLRRDGVFWVEAPIVEAPAEDVAAEIDPEQANENLDD
ncbi:MAG: class II fructose-bisphosphate aldolase [Candidatus Kaelpia aquatica]|nr:class II fructose-bisphosphate aldolase [Candidatus Kaelpia aquatica]